MKPEQVYSLLLKLYPKNYRQKFGEEMHFVFSQSLNEAYAEDNKKEGVIKFWSRTVFDVIKSIVTEHLQNQKGGAIMKSKNNDIIMKNRIFPRIALASILILLLPLVLTMANIASGGVEGQGWYWKPGDYIFGFIMIFGFSSLFVLIARKTNKKHRLAVGLIVLLAFLWLWAEFAVGVFTTWGS